MLGPLVAAAAVAVAAAAAFSVSLTSWDDGLSLLSAGMREVGRGLEVVGWREGVQCGREEAVRAAARKRGHPSLKLLEIAKF